MNTFLGLPPKQLVVICFVAISGFVLLPGGYKWVWMLGCFAYSAWRQLSFIYQQMQQIRQRIPTAKEILAVMTPVAILPSRDVQLSAYSTPLRIGRLLENGDFEMYCGEPFLRYRFDDGTYVKIQAGMPDRRITFPATHWQEVPV